MDLLQQLQLYKILQYLLLQGG